MLCGPADTILDVLKQQYDEAPTGEGVFDGTLYQLWENRRTGTWTFVLVTPGGGVCALASGEDWQTIPPQIKPKGTAL